MIGPKIYINFINIFIFDHIIKRILISWIFFRLNSDCYITRCFLLDLGIVCNQLSLFFIHTIFSRRLVRHNLFNMFFRIRINFEQQPT